MFGFPAETFFWFVPWPFIWVGLATVLYFKLKREDELEDKMEEEKNQNK
ncbi:hypothetical protein [Sporosarcina sp. P13]|nr:hypothetical protein [Sporosarcina sp. P13]